MAILNAFIKGMLGPAAGAAASGLEALGGMASNPLSALGGSLEGITALFDDPENFQKYLEQRPSQGSGSNFAAVPYTQASVPMAPTGGFINQNPNYLNTEQLILRGLL